MLTFTKFVLQVQVSLALNFLSQAVSRHDKHPGSGLVNNPVGERQMACPGIWYTTRIGRKLAAWARCPIFCRFLSPRFSSFMPSLISHYSTSDLAMMHQAYGLSMSALVIIPPPLFQFSPCIRKEKDDSGFCLFLMDQPPRFFSNHQEISADGVGLRVSQNQIGCAGTQHNARVGQRGFMTSTSDDWPKVYRKPPDVFCGPLPMNNSFEPNPAHWRPCDSTAPDSATTLCKRRQKMGHHPRQRNVHPNDPASLPPLWWS